MKDDMKETLSAFVDDEVHDADMLDELLSEQEARITLARYSLISDVMRNRYAHHDVDISAQVSQLLEQEATVIAPKRWFQSPKVVQQTAGLAIAATVAAVAVLTVGNFPATNDEPAKIAVGPITDQPIRMTSAVQKKLSGYLVSHNEFSASGKMQGILPYSRIASSPTGQRLVVQTGAKLEK